MLEYRSISEHFANKSSSRHTQRLLLEREENGVDELDVLERVVDHVVEFESL